MPPQALRPSIGCSGLRTFQIQPRFSTQNQASSADKLLIHLSPLSQPNYSQSSAKCSRLPSSQQHQCRSMKPDKSNSPRRDNCWMSISKSNFIENNRSDRLPQRQSSIWDQLVIIRPLQPIARPHVAHVEQLVASEPIEWDREHIQRHIFLSPI